MLCHVCRRAAVGQCKHCSRFYCAEHGRNGQVQWVNHSPNLTQTITLQEIALPTQIDILLKDPDALANDPYLANPLRETLCYCCESPALCSCVRCGRLGCARHVRRGELRRGHQVFCQHCLPGQNALAWTVLLLIALVWGGLLVLWVLL